MENYWVEIEHQCGARIEVPLKVVIGFLENAPRELKDGESFILRCPSCGEYTISDDLLDALRGFPENFTRMRIFQKPEKDR